MCVDIVVAEKLREWTDRTKPKLKAGFDAC